MRPRCVVSKDHITTLFYDLIKKKDDTISLITTVSLPIDFFNVNFEHIGQTNQPTYERRGGKNLS